jgi:hypothetical protein
MPDKRDMAKDRAMCEAATKGPWEVYTTGYGHYGVCQKGNSRCQITHAYANFEGYGNGSSKRDSTLIAESRTMTPYYLDLCETQQERLKELEAALERAIAKLMELGFCAQSKLGPKVLSKSTREEKCPDCIRDYLDAKAKEGLRNER